MLVRERRAVVKILVRSNRMGSMSKSSPRGIHQRTPDHEQRASKVVVSRQETRDVEICDSGKRDS
jgi:hypothetical protein